MMSLMRKFRVASELGLSVLAIALLAACGKESENGSSTVSVPATTGLLTSILISPAASSVTACIPTQFAATGYYSDGTSQNVTTGIFWQIDPASSGVAIADSSTGQIVGISPGRAIVTGWSGNITATSAVLTVTGGSLNSIAITPASATIATTATQAYAANATCSNGMLNIAAYNIWSSSNTSVATMGNYGLATAVAAGTTVITATTGAVAASSVLNVQ